VRLALPPAIALRDLDRQRLLDQLPRAGGLVRHRQRQADHRNRTRLADPMARLAMQRPAWLQVRACPTDLSGYPI
jgi:hypothetical protein